MEEKKVKTYKVLIFPFKCSNQEESIVQKEIIHALINYLYEKDSVCICRREDDYYGLYGKWFPYVSIKKIEQLSKVFAKQANGNTVKIINLSGSKISLLNEKYKDYIEIDFQKISVRKIHSYFAACQIAHKFCKSHRIQYYGVDSTLFQEFIKKFVVEIDGCLAEKKVFRNNGLCLYILDDEIPNETLDKLKRNIDASSIVLFLNDQLKYMFYQPENTYYIEHVIPYPIRFYNCAESKGEIMMADETILYAYTLDDDLKKDLLSTKIQRLMDRIGIENDRTSIENAFLRGMLEATERKVLYLQQQLNELQNCK